MGPQDYRIVDYRTFPPVESRTNAMSSGIGVVLLGKPERRARHRVHVCRRQHGGRL